MNCPHCDCTLQIVSQNGVSIATCSCGAGFEIKLRELRPPAKNAEELAQRRKDNVELHETYDADNNRVACDAKGKPLASK